MRQPGETRGRTAQRYAYRTIAKAYCPEVSDNYSVRTMSGWIKRDKVLLGRLMRAGFRPRIHYLTSHHVWLLKQRWGAPEDAPQADTGWHRTSSPVGQASEALAAIDWPMV